MMPYSYTIQGTTYSTKGINDLLNKINDPKNGNMKKACIKDLVDMRSLSNVLARAGKDRVADKIVKLADNLEEYYEDNFYTNNPVNYNAEDSRKSCYKQAKKVSRSHYFALVLGPYLDSTTVLDYIVNKTFDDKDKFYMDSGVLNVDLLTEQDCIAIADNFRRYLKNKDTKKMQSHFIEENMETGKTI